MSKRVISLLLALAMSVTLFNVTAVAVVTDEAEIPEHISNVKDVYKPGETYFVSESTEKWVGEDNIEGDKTLECFAPGTTNSHGRFGGLWQSMGFANYVFYNVFGEIPQFGYHCNPSELNDTVKVVGRYASSCRYLRDETDGVVSEENVKALLADAKQGDVLVVAPAKKCNTKGNAMVIIDVSETFITVYHADYKGSCAVTQDTISFDALDDYHCITLLRSADYPYPQPVPPVAVEKVTLSASDFALNESVSITWPLTKNAQKYKVYLLDAAGNVAEQGEFTSSVTSFLFKTAGKYRLKVVASNVYGDSPATYSDEIVVHNQNVVVFKDYDGTVITTQRVEYGSNAVAPNVPQRKGYQFAGWDKSLENITEPTEITATYEIEKYTIKYYDVGGVNPLRPETVEYQGKANPPTNYTLREGYVFAGWQISFDSVGTDYNCVDGDMTLIATEKWGAPNRPITIAVSNGVRVADGTKYTATLTVTNHDAAAGKNIKILGSLKGADGKALKIVVLQELSLKANESVTKGIEIVYSEKATTMEFVAVGMVGNSKTGGAFSEITSFKILDNTSWGAWSDWTTEELISSYDAYETKTQYRYRNKTYTTSSSSTLSGWTKYDKTESVGEWSKWSTSSVTAFENDSQKRETKSRYIEPTYKTQYHYYHYCKGYYSIWTHASSGGTFHDLWVDSKLAYAFHSGGMDWYQGAGCSGRGCPYWFICDGTTYGGPGPWTRKVKTGGDYYEYQYRDTYYTYHFWKLGDWSTWNDTYKFGDETDTRKLYRYRNRSESGDPENTTGEIFNIVGELRNVPTDLNGMIATIMVYKKCNTDPTEEQLQFIGQTTIGAGNTYSFAFKPIDMPSSTTGDFVVALGIEGADRIVNVDVIKAEVPSYQVKFIADGVVIEDENAQEFTDSDGNRFKVQLVAEGGTAIAPEPPAKEGYTFAKWSETLTGIKTDKVITAIYEPNEYSLVFIDWETNTVTSQKMKYGDTIVYPVLDSVVGANNRIWDKQQEGIEIVTGNMIIGSVAILNEYTVRFMSDDQVVSAQTVKYGHSATLPEQIPTAEGMVFSGWVGSCSYEYITQDAIFKPFFLYSQTVAMPEAVVEQNDDGSSTVALSCETDGAQIYYVIEQCCENASLMDIHNFEGGIWDDAIELLEEVETEDLDAFRSKATQYTGEITLQADETITFIAYAEGMNESIPASETNETESVYYDVAVGNNTMRQYKNSVEGSVVVNIMNDCPEYEHGTVTLCFYDDKGVLLEVIPQSVEIVPGKNVVEFTDVKLVGTRVKNADIITCKVMSWLWGEQITPITDVLEFNLK